MSDRPSMSAPPFRDVTVGDLLTRLAQSLPDREALVYADGPPRFTFATLEQEARTIARGLMALGVARGERVVLWATNVPEWVVLQFAVAKAGAILVTANTSLRSRDASRTRARDWRSWAQVKWPSCSPSPRLAGSRTPKRPGWSAWWIEWRARPCCC